MLKGEHRLEMKTEVLSVLLILEQLEDMPNGLLSKKVLKKNHLMLKVLEFKKANFPPVLGKFFHKTLVDVLKGAQQAEIDASVKIFKQQILDGSISLNRIR
jgi:hypothetical protein